MTVGKYVAAAGALALSACATAQPVPVHGAPTGQRCDPANIQQFVGQQRSPELEQQMLAVSHARTVRWVPPGTAITMEFSYERLTVFLDASNRVERISCS
jgi:hypothetical protein